MSGWLDTAISALSDELCFFFKAYWPDAKEFFNSVFFTAIAGSLAGAFAGARAAQSIAEKTRNKDELLREIRVTNAATMVVFGICNTLLSAKKQHIKSLKTQFDQQRASTREAIARRADIDFHPDFRTLPILTLPLSILQAQIFEKLSVHGRPIALITTLIQSVDGLNMAIMKRNQLVEFYKARSLSPGQLLALYFGFPYEGQVNQEYPDSMEAIFTQTDDGIFFSTKLCDDLSEHGDQLKASFEKRFGKNSPQITKPDFSKARDDDLMPSDGNYTDWINMFVKQTDRSSHGV